VSGSKVRVVWPVAGLALAMGMMECRSNCHPERSEGA
jgi:hypothetical protein